MAKRKVKRRVRKKALGKELVDIEKKIEKQIDRDFKEVEAWMVQRRKFLIKLAWVLGFITVLLIVSHFYLRVGG